MDIQQILGVASAILLLYAGYPYIRDILYGSARPNRVTWFGWTLLSGSSALIQISHGPDYSAMYVGADAILNLSIFMLSLYRGVVLFTLVDGICLLFGSTGLVLWLVLDQPVLALVANIAADLSFGVPTLIKVFKDSGSESRRSWALMALGGFLGLLSKTDLGLTNSLFPVFLFVMSFTFYALCTDKPQELLGYRKVS